MLECIIQLSEYHNQISLERIKTITDNIIPPTINLDNLDENVANLNYVANKALKQEVHAALSNSFGFGGHNATLLFKEV